MFIVIKNGYFIKYFSKKEILEHFKNLLYNKERKYEKYETKNENPNKILTKY